MNGRRGKRSDAPGMPMRPILQGWLDRHEPTPSGDLLFEVMKEVETVAQKGSTRAWLSWFADSPAAGWMVATAAVAALAIAVVVFMGLGPGKPAPGGDVTPTPTASPTAESSRAPLGLAPEKLIDQLLADWNAGDDDAAMRIYAQGVTLRMTDDGQSWTTTAVGELQLRNALLLANFHGLHISRAGALVQQGDWYAVPMTYQYGRAEFGDQTTRSDAVAVVHVVDGFVANHFVFEPRSSGWIPAFQGLHEAARASEEIVQLVDDELAAVNAHDGDANAAFFSEYGRMGIYVGNWTTGQEFVPQAVAEWTVDTGETALRITRSGSVMQQGAFVVWPWTSTETTGSAEGVTLIQLDFENKIVNYWSVGAREGFP